MIFDRKTQFSRHFNHFDANIFFDLVNLEQGFTKLDGVVITIFLVNLANFQKGPKTKFLEFREKINFDFG